MQSLLDNPTTVDPFAGTDQWVWTTGPEPDDRQPPAPYTRPAAPSPEDRAWQLGWTLGHAGDVNAVPSDDMGESEREQFHRGQGVGLLARPDRYADVREWMAHGFDHGYRAQPLDIPQVIRGRDGMTYRNPGADYGVAWDEMWLAAYGDGQGQREHEQDTHEDALEACVV